MEKKDDLRDLNICMVAGAGEARLVISEAADLLMGRCHGYPTL